MPAEAVRILVVDDHAIFREGVKLLLQREADMRIAGEAAAADAALALAARDQPDVILLDLDLEGFDALDIVESLRAVAPAVRILVLTGMRSPELQGRALRLGAKGFVLKEQSAELLVRAIRKIVAGELWFDRGTVEQAVTRLMKGDAEAPAVNLTARELDIVRLIGEGLKNDAIGKRLFISEKTVRNHLTTIFEKVGVEDRLHLALYAYRRGLAKLPK
jgi:DNA-binding NarL/FixJ family response regulator